MKTTRFKGISYKDCIGGGEIDRSYHVNAGDINPATGKAYAINPSTGNWDDNYFSSHFGNQSSSSSGAPSFSSVLSNAQALQNYFVQANQPSIQTLGSQIPALQQQYNDLLTNIQGQGSVAVNQQTAATNAELAARGLLSQSGYGQQQIANALLPVTTQFGGLEAQTGLSEQQNINNITSQIAQLQAGNPSAALTSATGIYDTQQQAANLQSQLANAIQQAQIQANAQVQSAQIGASRPIEVGAGNQIYNPTTGQFLGSVTSFLGNTGNSSYSGGNTSSGGVSNIWDPSKIGGVSSSSTVYV